MLGRIEIGFLKDLAVAIRRKKRPSETVTNVK